MARQPQPEIEEEDAGEDAAAEVEAPAEQPAGRFKARKLALFAGAPLLVLLLGAGGAAWWFDLLGAGGAAAPEPKPVVFHALPEMVVNLNTGGRQQSYLKLRIALELDDAETVARIEQMLPRIMDQFQTHLRELRSDDLAGSAGLYRLKEELLARINVAVQPAHINDVLFKEMLVQ